MHVVIAGAGISGLAAAISLRRTGHKVTIYERSSLNNEVGAAINVPPNVSRFLAPWGLDPVACRMVNSRAVHFIHPTTLEQLFVHDHSKSAEMFGGPLYYAHRVDLHEGLKKLATDPKGLGIPAEIHLKSPVQSYDPETPSITLANGKVVTADLIVAADGIHSEAVERMLGHPNPAEPAKHTNCCYRFLLSREELESDPETKWFLEGEQPLGLRIWPDPPGQRRFISYGCRNHEVFNFAGICNNDEATYKPEDWHSSVDRSEFLNLYTGFHPCILALIKKATDVKRYPLLYRAPLPTYHKNKMVLTGDAAHPMLPHQGQGGAQAQEDGLALGLVFANMTDLTQIEERLEVYDKIRRNRASSIQILSNFGTDEDVSDELGEYLEGEPVPSNAYEKVKLGYSHDVVQKTVKQMKKYDPSFKIPDGFFPNSPES